MANLSLTLNPYFNENPVSFKLGMWVECLLGLSINLFGVYCDIFKYPRSMVLVYRLLNINFMIVSTLFHVSFTGATTFVVMLPYMALFPVGFLRLFSLSSMSQFVIIMSLWAGTGGAMVAPFICRVQLLLPKDHIFNLPIVKIIVYFNLCFAYIFSTPIVWYLFLSYSIQHQQLLKNNAAKYFGLTSELLFDNYTLIMDWDLDHPSVIIVIILLSIGIVAIVVSIPGCCAICSYELKKLKQNMSPKTRAMHKAYITSLMSQMSVCVVLFAVPLMFCAILLFAESPRCDLFNYASLIVGLSSPAGTVTMILTTKSYYKFVRNLFRHFMFGTPMQQHSAISITVGGKGCKTEIR